jgi:hypothetical protein
LQVAVDNNFGFIGVPGMIRNNLPFMTLNA